MDVEDDEDSNLFEMRVNNNEAVCGVLREFDLTGSVIQECPEILTLEFFTPHEHDRAREALLTVDAWPDGRVPKTAGGN